MIGNLERLLLTVLVAAGSYTGLTFLIALKGLTRFEKLNDQDFAEYFLLGSLLSVLIGLVAGLLIRMTLIALWPELLALEMQPSMF